MKIKNRAMKRYVIGDIHGNYKALAECVDRSGFNKEKDELIFLGDIVDGHPDTDKCVDFMLECSNKVLLIGNHDAWAKDMFFDLEWENNFSKFDLFAMSVKRDPPNRIWISQGGASTVDSYLGKEDLFKKHKEYFNSMIDYHTEDNDVFVHAGLIQNLSLENHTLQTLTWDRSLYNKAVTSAHFNVVDDLKTVEGFKRIFIGHTSTQEAFPDLKPHKLRNLWNLDQGGGWSGKLTIMDINTEEYWQSDKTEAFR